MESGENNVKFVEEKSDESFTETATVEGDGVAEETAVSLRLKARPVATAAWRFPPRSRAHQGHQPDTSI